MTEHYTKDHHALVLCRQAHGDSNHPIGVEDYASDHRRADIYHYIVGANMENVMVGLLGHDIDRRAAEEESLDHDTDHLTAKEYLVVEGEPFHPEGEVLLVRAAHEDCKPIEWYLLRHTCCESNYETG